MIGQTAQGATGTKYKAARAVTELLSPINQVPLLVVAVALRYTSTVIEALMWSVLAVVFATAIPLVYILHALGHQRITDYHVKKREQRKIVAKVIVPSVIAGAALLYILGAPPELAALTTSLAMGIFSAYLITLVWKISVHVAVTAGATAVLTLTFGPSMLLLSPVIPLSAWSRVVLRDHTPLQTLAGALLGAVVAGSVFASLR